MACNDINSSCTDSCDQIDGLFEAASNLVQYRDIIEKWINGKQNETVQIGGEFVKTILGLIADIKQLVGVLPDGRTIILDDKRKVLSVLLVEGGGIKIKAEGGLYVDVNDILVLGGGLAKDEYGRIYVDFSQMPTDKFEELLKSIRVPIWLSKNKDLYVNGTTGSDVLDDRRGESEEKPFKTIQACLNFCCDNFNLSRYKTTINLLEGTYKENVSLPRYSSAGGFIEIVGKNGGVVVEGSFYSSQPVGTYYLKDIGILSSTFPAEISSFYVAVRTSQGATINIENVSIDISGDTGTTYKHAVGSFTGGTIIIRKGCSITGPCSNCFHADAGTIINIYNDISIDGVKANIIARASASGFIDVSSAANGGIMPVISGEATGMRYRASLNGIIRTNNSGPEYFPGTTNGIVETGGQYA